LSPTKKSPKTTTKRRSVLPSTPEVKVGYAAAGRDTLAAIDAELTQSARPLDAPVIEIRETPAGRETLAAIETELADAPRSRQDTTPYGDRISNAPGSRSPSRAPAPPPAERQPGALEIFELVTFLVRGNEVGELSTDAHRRRFVEAHLLGRIPGGTMAHVERVEVTPWTTQGTMVVRVWCRA
jgi:hypothetical protein